MSLKYTVGSAEPASRSSSPASRSRSTAASSSWTRCTRASPSAAGWPSSGPPRAPTRASPATPKLAFVTTRVVAARTAAYTNYGITGRGTELTLADAWLDEFDVLLSHIRDTTVYAAGEPLRLADEPLGEDVARQRDRTRRALRRAAARPLGSSSPASAPTSRARPAYRPPSVTIAAADRPSTPGCPATPSTPGSRSPPTWPTATAARPSRPRQRRRATQGETRDEAIGSGDADRGGQTFALWQSPLTWLADDNPLGASTVLEIRVDGVLLARGRQPGRTRPGRAGYITGSTADGRTTVTFGDGVHGARLPTGHENIRARYRFGTGRAANVPPDRDHPAAHPAARRHRGDQPAARHRRRRRRRRRA